MRNLFCSAVNLYLCVIFLGDHLVYIAVYIFQIYNFVYSTQIEIGTCMIFLVYMDEKIFCIKFNFKQFSILFII